MKALSTHYKTLFFVSLLVVAVMNGFIFSAINMDGLKNFLYDFWQTRLPLSENLELQLQTQRSLFMMIFISSLLSLWAALIARPAQGFIVWVLSNSVYFGVTMLSLTQWGLVIDIAPIVLAGLISYYFLLPARLVVETHRTENQKVLMARQIGHDIKSPLSALTMIASISDSLPEKQKSLLNRATKRVETIANKLSAMGEQRTK
jgi:signal transduction histidine kinase